MAKIHLSQFCSYEFETDDEEKRAQILPPQNQQWIQTKISALAVAEINFDVDPADPTSLAEKASLKGQRVALQELLEESKDALAILVSRTSQEK